MLLFPSKSNSFNLASAYYFVFVLFYFIFWKFPYFVIMQSNAINIFKIVPYKHRTKTANKIDCQPRVWNMFKSKELWQMQTKSNVFIWVCVVIYVSFRKIATFFLFETIAIFHNFSLNFVVLFLFYLLVITTKQGQYCRLN